ncbi:MAG: MBL fold metallo-hydrolase [Phycisphaerales bacterium]|nr:MBL fold metallo-hydrolase [Phycisphaerales bacterium]
MIPKPPPREGTLGFLYIPPFRVQGISIAGEITCLQIPELDLGFDIGSCPRALLSSKYLAISHGHMDHIGALAYYCSQRKFQGMGTAKIVCDARIESDIRGMMAGFVNLERQKTPYEIIALQPEGQVEIKNNMFLRGFPTEHTCPSFGYSVYERRTKLKPEFAEYPQEKLKELKDRGVEITRTLTIPLIAYLGDTQPGPHLIREDVRKAQIVICECTFFEPDHKDRAKIGMHMHVDDVAEWLRVLECDALILIHVSRRTDLNYARKRFAQVCGSEKAQKVHFLMDFRSQRVRYEEQLAAAEAHAAALGQRRAAPEEPADEPE